MYWESFSLNPKKLDDSTIIKQIGMKLNSNQHVLNLGIGLIMRYDTHLIRRMDGHSLNLEKPLFWFS